MSLHTLKGLSSMLGARDLCARVTAAQRVFDTGVPPDDGVLEALRGVKSEASLFMDAALLLVDRFDAPALAVAPRAALPAGAEAKLLVDLLALLQASDMRAFELFDRLRENPGVINPSNMILLNDSIGLLDFDRAAVACRQLLTEVSS
jgi:hypothetical protein